MCPNLPFCKEEASTFHVSYHSPHRHQKLKVYHHSPYHHFQQQRNSATIHWKRSPCVQVFLCVKKKHLNCKLLIILHTVITFNRKKNLFQCKQTICFIIISDSVPMINCYCDNYDNVCAKLSGPTGNKCISL